MLTLRDIMTREVVTVDPELPVRDAMELLGSRHLSGAPVVAGNDVVGVISMADLIELSVSLPAGAAARPMEPDGDDRRLEDDGESSAVFFADMWEDSDTEVVEHFESAGGPGCTHLGEHTVSEVMTRHVRSLPPETAVLRAAAVMTDEGIHRVLVMDGARLVGIVSLTDIARAAAARRLNGRT